MQTFNRFSALAEGSEHAGLTPEEHTSGSDEDYDEVREAVRATSSPASSPRRPRNRPGRSDRAKAKRVMSAAPSAPASSPITREGYERVVHATILLRQIGLAEVSPTELQQWEECVYLMRIQLDMEEDDRRCLLPPYLPSSA